MKISQIKDIYVVDGRDIVLHFDDIDNFIMEVPSVSHKVKLSEAAITDIARNSMPVVAFNTGKLSKELMRFASQEPTEISRGVPHTISVFFPGDDKVTTASIPGWIEPEARDLDKDFFYEVADNTVRPKSRDPLSGMYDITYFCRKNMVGYNFSQKPIDGTFKIFLNFIGDNGQEYTIILSQASVYIDFGVKSERNNRVNSMMAVRITPLGNNKTGYWSILEKEEVV